VRIAHTRTEGALLGLPSLFFVYVLLVALGLLYSSTFAARTLSGQDIFVSSGGGSSFVMLLVLMGIPAALFLFLVIQLIRLVREVAERRAGARLRVRFLLAFLGVAALASLPVMAVSSRFSIEALKGWFSQERVEALQDARIFAFELYKSRLSELERAATSNASAEALKAVVRGDSQGAQDWLKRADPNLVCIQAFVEDGQGGWRETAMAGSRARALDEPPVSADTAQEGFIPRDSTRDVDVARYLALSGKRGAIILTIFICEQFDQKTFRVDEVIRKDENIATLKPVIGRTLLALYILFALPTILMTMIIAIRLSSELTLPIASLEAATRRVAEGDFGVRIVSRQDDELGVLVASFNAMVGDLAASRDQSLREEKINIWKDMAQRLAHEIKNPLTPIKLSAERLLRRWRIDPSSVGEILEPSMLAIAQEVDGLVNMLSEFRTFARLPDPARELTNIRTLITDSIALYQASYPAVIFDQAQVRDDIVVRADPRHLSQVLSNLIGNAIDAMKGRGRIDFSADLVQKRESRYCRISVRDNGSGISESAKGLIFTPYFTTKSSGTGLGLAIVERIVSGHGGSIWVDSEEGAGATFYFDLPVDKTVTS